MTLSSTFTDRQLRHPRDGNASFLLHAQKRFFKMLLTECSLIGPFTFLTFTFGPVSFSSLLFTLPFSFAFPLALFSLALTLVSFALFLHFAFTFPAKQK